MSLYLTLLFFLLVTEMCTLLLLLLPLPHMVRKRIGSLYHKMATTSQIRTMLIVFGVLVSSLFVDSIKRGNRPLPLDRTLVTPEMLASKAYHQRNIYISGFILYFGVCIPIVMGVIAKLVKYEDTYRAANEEAKITKDTPVNKKLFRELEQKEADLMALEKQYANRNEFLDKKLDEENGIKNLEEKKKD